VNIRWAAAELLKSKCKNELSCIISVPVDPFGDLNPCIDPLDEVVQFADLPNMGGHVERRHMDTPVMFAFEPVLAPPGHLLQPASRQPLLHLKSANPGSWAGAEGRPGGGGLAAGLVAGLGAALCDGPSPWGPSCLWGLDALTARECDVEGVLWLQNVANPLAHLNSL
jgi:hypothetical protein